MKRFSPHVNTDAYRVSFVPVGDVHVERAWALVEIRVKPGERFEMYEDMNHEVSSLMTEYCFEGLVEYCNEGLIYMYTSCHLIVP